MRVIFVDPRCPGPTAPPDLAACPIGGTESSLLHIAEGLAGAGHQVTVLQAGRSEAAQFGALYAPLDHDPGPADRVIVRDDAQVARRWCGGRAPVLLWRHDFAKAEAPALAGLAGRATLVAVSDHHARALRADLPGLRVHHLPNPVVVHDPGAVPIARGQLLFAASPHKHLWQALRLFEAVRLRLPDLRLIVANPGYHPAGETWGAGVEPVGALSRPALHRLLKGSLALFHATDFPETFGLLLAEAQALGTPVLVPPVGAAPEVVTDPRQCRDLSDPDAVAAELAAWQAGARPAPGADPRFALPRVLGLWQALLADAAAP